MGERWILDPDVTMDDPEIQTLLKGFDPGQYSKGFEPYAFEIPVGFGLGLAGLRRRPCCRCGASASRSEMHLTRGERTFYCEVCR